MTRRTNLNYLGLRPSHLRRRSARSVSGSDVARIPERRIIRRDPHHACSIILWCKTHAVKAVRVCSVASDPRPPYSPTRRPEDVETPSARAVSGAC
jgi:hypothetical protein